LRSYFQQFILLSCFSFLPSTDGHFGGGEACFLVVESLPAIMDYDFTGPTNIYIIIAYIYCTKNKMPDTLNISLANNMRQNCQKHIYKKHAVSRLQRRDITYMYVAF